MIQAHRLVIVECVSGTLRAKKQNREPNNKTETEPKPPFFREPSYKTKTELQFFRQPKPNRDAQY